MGPRTLLLADVGTEVHVEDPLLAAAFADALGECPPARSPALVAITDQGPPPAVPDVDPDDAFHSVRLWWGDGALVLAWGSVLTARVHSGVMVVARHGGAPVEVTRAVRQILPLALGHLLGAHDRVLLHAGAVLHDGRGVLILGPTGAGKSTLVFAARRAGWPVAADDLVVVRARDDAVEVIGIPRPLALDGDAPRDAPGAKPIGDDVRERWQLPLEGVGGAHPLAAVVLVGHSDRGEGHLESVSASEVWDVVLGSFLAAPEPVQLRAAFPVLAAVSRRPGWRLGHGADAATRLDVAAQLLAKVAATADG